MPEPHSKPTFAVPAGATDCHVHVFGPFAKFPLAAKRGYTPDPATADDLIARMDAAGVGRAVIVQPSAYGTDNRATLDGIARHPKRLRGVAVIDASFTSAQLQSMHAAGVRGIRLNVVSGGGPNARDVGRLLEAYAAKLAPLGWHIQIYAHFDTIAAIVPHAGTLPVHLVFDHMGGPVEAQGIDGPGFKALRQLLGSGRCWVKLSGPYRVAGPADYGDDRARVAASTLHATNPERCVWGSDWPWIGEHARTAHAAAPPVAYRPIDYGRLLSQVPTWLAARKDQERVLVANPALLYGFA